MMKKNVAFKNWYLDVCKQISFMCTLRGDSISPIKTPRYSFLRTNMQCGFIKVMRMKIGSSNCKLIVAS